VSTSFRGGPLARLIVIIGTVSYFVLLNWIYIDILSPVYAYYGFIYEKPTSSYFWLSCIVGLLPSLWLCTKIERPSQLMHWMLYLVIVLPTASIPFYALETSPSQLFLVEVSIVAACCLIGIIYHVPLWRLGSVGMSPGAFWALFAFFSVIVYATFIANFGVSFSAPSLVDVYDVRADFTATGRALHPFENYFVSWIGYNINPVLILYGALTTNVPLVLMGAAGQLYIYSVSAQKSFVMAPIFLLLLPLLSRDRARFFIPALAWSGPIAMLLCLLVDHLQGGFTMNSLFTRRVFALPGLLTGMYFEYYSHEPMVMMSDGFLKFLFSGPPPVSPALVIGEFYWNSPDAHVNSNLWATAYAHFGFVGVFVSSLLLAVVFHLYDSLSQKLSLGFACVFLAISASSLTNAALPTSLMNHGLGLTVLIVAAFPKPEHEASEIVVTGYDDTGVRASPRSHEACVGCRHKRIESV